MPETKQNVQYGKEFVSWQITEYPHYEHGFFWYLGLVAAGVTLVIYALWTKNFLFAFIVIMFAIVFLIHAGRRPIICKFAITESGIVLHEKLYPWKELARFFIIYEPPEVKTLYFEFGSLRPRLPVPLDDQDPMKVREILLKFLREDSSQTEEPISDWFGRLLKI